MLDPKLIRLCTEFFYLRKQQRKVSSYACILGAKWIKLGSGYYGEAWQHRDYPELCMKISGPQGWGCGDNYAVRDGIRIRGQKRHDAWPVFARHCQANPHPNLPQILHLEQPSEFMTWGIMPMYRDWDGIAHGDLYNGITAVLSGIDDTLPNKQDPAWLWPLKQMAGGLYMAIDLHWGNVMLDRVTGDLILIDPFSTTGESDAY